MIKITAQQLPTQLKKGLSACYILTGNDPLLQIESIDKINAVTVNQSFEKYTFIIDTQTDWSAIFECCHSLSFFSSKTLILLQLPESGISAAINEKLNQLIALKHADIIFILQCPKFTKTQENTPWFKSIESDVIIINCATPSQIQFSTWIADRAAMLTLNIDQQSIQLLAYYYEGNLLALSQTLNMLHLLYPDGKITLPRLEHQLIDVAQFTPYHWLDAVLQAKSDRCWHILQQLKADHIEPLILLRVIQKELLLLITLQRQLKSSTQSLKSLFDIHKVWQQRRPLISQALQRLSLSVLYQALSHLVALEISLKQQFSDTAWEDLESLSLLLCKNPLQHK